MKQRLPIAIVAAVLLALAGSQWLGEQRGSTPPLPPDTSTPTAAAATPAGPAALTSAAPAAPGSALVVHDVVVREEDGRFAWRGDVDLAPTLQRIEAGRRDGHRNDGGVFGNREGLLPEHPAGYYHEYVIRTPGISHAGPQRLIIGAGGELYYTSDHYASFRRIR